MAVFTQTHIADNRFRTKFPKRKAMSETGYKQITHIVLLWHTVLRVLTTINELLKVYCLLLWHTVLRVLTTARATSGMMKLLWHTAGRMPTTTIGEQIWKLWIVVAYRITGADNIYLCRSFNSQIVVAYRITSTDNRGETIYPRGASGSSRLVRLNENGRQRSSPEISR